MPVRAMSLQAGYVILRRSETENHELTSATGVLHDAKSAEMLGRVEESSQRRRRSIVQLVAKLSVDGHDESIADSATG